MSRDVNGVPVTHINALRILNDKSQKKLIIYSETTINKSQINLAGPMCVSTRDITKSVDKIKQFIDNGRGRFNCVIGLGGGTAIDIAKYIGYKMDCQCIAVPSMLSTNVFSTDKVALHDENGLKNTLDAKLPDKIIIDKNILKNSELQNSFGVADILSIHTALKDWQLADSKLIERINPEIYKRANSLLAETVHYINSDYYDSESVDSKYANLYNLISKAGYITNIYGAGRPESGSEHVFAKELESKCPNLHHGVSVSIGIILMSLLQDNYSSRITRTIEKLGILQEIRNENISTDILSKILIELKPREDSYSIVNEYEHDVGTVDKIISKYYNVAQRAGGKC